MPTSKIAYKLVVSVVRVVLPDTASKVALMLVLPEPTEVAKPLEPAALEIVAIPGTEEAQVTDVVRSSVVPSEKVPVAINCWVVPAAMLGFGGVRASETKTGLVTVKVVLPDIASRVAVIIEVPRDRPVANPWVPSALETVATPLIEELHATCELKSCVVSSEKNPVAVNCPVKPLAILGLVGVTSIDTRTGLVTVKGKLADMAPRAAVISVKPTAIDVTNPWEPGALDTIATAVLEELHNTDEVISSVLPFM